MERSVAIAQGRSTRGKPAELGQSTPCFGRDAVAVRGHRQEILDRRVRFERDAEA